MHSRSKLYLGIVLIIFIAVILNAHYQKPVGQNSRSQVKKTVQKKAATAPASSANTSSQTTTNSSPPNSYDYASSQLVVVNKGRVLPAGYVPANLVVPNIPLAEGASSQNMHLRADAATALEQMANAASSAGAHLMVGSGYRSYSTQVSTYNAEVRNYGQVTADTESARPGHSEHQTGLAVDLEPTSGQCAITDCFANTVEGKWLAANAYKYGFLIRYAQNNQALTGYRYEPWHVRFVGSEVSNKIQVSGQTLEQYFGLRAYSDYPAQFEQLKS